MPHYILAHHGIEGQKWGVRNGPPYPLDESDYSRAEKKIANKARKDYHSMYAKAEQKSFSSQERNRSAVERGQVGDYMTDEGRRRQIHSETVYQMAAEKASKLNKKNRELYTKTILSEMSKDPVFKNKLTDEEWDNFYRNIEHNTASEVQDRITTVKTVGVPVAVASAAFMSRLLVAATLNI